jgi:glycosyltransferase involved in cell wall biosynthesis
MTFGFTSAKADAGAPMFTVFTPTYNRAHTLHRAHDSLRAQTCRDFEWLIVDDGSTDGTGSLVNGWIGTSDFPIRYIAQEHAGKHVAHNRALREARGRFFLVLDSDDACVPTALERIAYHWGTIPLDQRSSFSGVAGLCQNQRGEVVGDRFPSEPIDMTLREKQYVYRVRGEKWGADLTEIVRRFPFPKLPHTNFTPEGAVWLEIAKHYKIRCVNEVFRTYYIDDDSTGATLTRRTSLGASAPGRLHYYTWLLNNDLEFFFRAPMPFLKAAVMLPVVALYSSKPLRSVIASLNSRLAKALVLAGLPIALSFYLYDRSCTVTRRGYAD